jgi:hypothetical protein
MKKISSSLKEKNKIISLNIYTGEWVAFTNGKTIAHGQNLKNLMKKVQKLKNREKTSVMLVPKRTEGNHII